jgi:spore cortex formation protein SpoVR/YcgB (stage V sporulation)
VLDGVLLEDGDTDNVLQHLADLWGYDVLLLEMDEAEDVVMNEHTAKPRTTFG